ncbi:hypothetical protein MMC26_006991 [Xylographa opegraphella]|nr:hypothetical protein [Xylographa opegraphella]
MVRALLNHTTTREASRSDQSLALITAEKLSLNEPHLQFINSDLADDYYDDVDRFVKKLFPGQSPLEYEQHTVSVRNGKQVTLVNVEECLLKQSAAIFAEEYSRISLNSGTDLSRLKTSLVSRQLCSIWQSWFNRAFFTSSIHRGPALLQEISDTFRRDYAPPWVLALAFSVMVGLNFGSFVDGTITDQAIEQLLEAGSVTAFAILDKFATSKANKEKRKELELAWTSEREKFVHGNTDSLGSIATTDAETAEAELCQALYRMIESASLALVCNRDILHALKAARAKAESDLVLRGASVGLSLWAATSAFWTTSAVTGIIVTPIETWALGKVFMFTLFSQIPEAAIVGVELTTTFCLEKEKERAKWNNKIEYHNAMKTFIGVALGLAQDSQKFLQWVYNTNMSGPNEVDFVDDAARENWRKFIVRTRAATGGEATARELSPQFVRTYLFTQRDTLVRMQLSIKEAEKKLKV